MRNDNFNLTLYKNKQTTEQINQQNIQDEVTNFDFCNSQTQLSSILT